MHHDNSPWCVWFEVGVPKSNASIQRKSRPTIFLHPCAIWCIALMSCLRSTFNAETNWKECFFFYFVSFSDRLDWWSRRWFAAHVRSMKMKLKPDTPWESGEPHGTPHCISFVESKSFCFVRVLLLRYSIVKHEIHWLNFGFTLGNKKLEKKHKSLNTCINLSLAEDIVQVFYFKFVIL